MRQLPGTFRPLWCAVLLLLLLGVTGGYVACRHYQNREPARKRETVTIGLAREALNALMLIAVEQGLFAQEGLEVTIIDTYPSGKRALRGLLAGEVDVTTTSEVPLVFQSFTRQDFRVVATIGSSENEPKIIARKDQGISSPKDLRGKRIATQKASAVHFFLHMLLVKYGLSTQDVHLSYKKSEELPQALYKGEIDAFSIREPFISQEKSLLGKNLLSLIKYGFIIRLLIW